MKKFSFIIISLIVTASTFAKEPRVETVTIEDVYVVKDDESLKGARENAIMQAQLKALADKFGTTITGTSHMEVGNMAGHSGDNFYSYSGADVNGEWLETLSEEATPAFENGISVYRVKLKGKIREIVRNPIDVKWAVLSNGSNPETDRLRGDTFYIGDYMYLFFQTPVAGYLAVYLEDSESDRIAQCLLPYRGMTDGAMKIEANKPYVFFSKNDADPEIRHLVARLKINSNYDTDYNHIYIVFSPNEFWKASDGDNKSTEYSVYDKEGNITYLMPRETKSKDFHKWLAKNRGKDNDMQVFHTILKIVRD